MNTMRTDYLKKITSCFLIFAMIFALVATATVNVNAAGSKSYYLPTRYQTYKQVNGKWKKQSDYTYKYDKKGNLTKWAGNTLKLTYKNGKLNEVNITGKTDAYDKYDTIKEFNKNGKIKSLYFEAYKNGDSVNLRGYKYSYNKKGYIAKRTNVYDDSVVKYSYKYHKNGLPSQITETFSYEGYSYRKVEKYNKEGILKSSTEYENGKKTSSCTMKITKSKGKIKSVVETCKEGKKTTKTKCVFTYGKTKTKTQKKYVSVINMMLGGELAQTIGDNPIVGYCYWN